MNKLIFFALILVFDYGFAQRIILPENDISRTYVASVHGDFNLVGPTSNGTFLCIGTFFKRGSIVTAASCVADRANNADNLFVTASSTLKGHPNGGVVTDLFRIRSIHIHPGFNPNNPTENNLAILNVRLITSTFYRIFHLCNFLTNSSTQPTTFSNQEKSRNCMKIVFAA